MKVLLTGAFGFIGGRLALHLAAAGERIVLGSRHAAAPPAWLPIAPVAAMRWDSAASLESACRGIDAVVHLAGMNARDSAADPGAALAFNGAATGRLVEAAAQAGVRRFVHLSTAHVYGNLEGVITEETPASGTHPYATSHLAGERAALDAGAKIEAVVGRLSNAYGAPAHAGADCWTLLVNDLCRQAVTDRKLTLRTAGLQRRDFIAMDEACRAIRHLMQAPASAVSGGTFNIGGAWAPTVLEMATLAQDRTTSQLGFRPELVRPPAGPGERSAALDFRIDRLRDSGFAPAPRTTAEIDGLLDFCAREFVGLNS